MKKSTFRIQHRHLINNLHCTIIYNCTIAKELHFACILTKGQDMKLYVREKWDALKGCMTEKKKNVLVALLMCSISSLKDQKK